MLPGIKVYDLKRLPDERGFFAEILREDWENLLEGDHIVQGNLSMSYPGIIRAWHRHVRGQVDYFVVVKGALKICAYDGDETSETFGELTEIIATSEKLQVVRVPGNYWHGTKAVGNEPALVIYFVTKLYNHANPDEQRRPWNDPTVVPKSINGRADDPRVGKPWDWLALPYK